MHEGPAINFSQARKKIHLCWIHLPLPSLTSRSTRQNHPRLHIEQPRSGKRTRTKTQYLPPCRTWIGFLVELQPPPTCIVSNLASTRRTTPTSFTSYPAVAAATTTTTPAAQTYHEVPKLNLDGYPYRNTLSWTKTLISPKHTHSSHGGMSHSNLQLSDKSGHDV